MRRVHTKLKSLSELITLWSKIYKQSRFWFYRYIYMNISYLLEQYLLVYYWSSVDFVGILRFSWKIRLLGARNMNINFKAETSRKFRAASFRDQSSLKLLIKCKYIRGPFNKERSEESIETTFFVNMVAMSSNFF